MTQDIFSFLDPASIYDGATDARVYRYPSAGLSALAAIEWGHGRRAYAHTRAAKWIGGFLVNNPERGYPLYRSDRWDEYGSIYLVSSEAEADALAAHGLNATTWINPGASGLPWNDWQALDGWGVTIWLPEPLIRPATRHLWRYNIMPGDIALPLEFLRTAWKIADPESTRDEIRESIKNELYWLPPVPGGQK